MPPATSWTPPGARRRHITIQQQDTSSKTAMGFLKPTWTDVLTTWASVRPKTMVTFAAVGKVAGDQPMVRNLYEVNIRYVPSVTILPGMRVVEPDGAVYLIQSVADVEQRHRELSLACSQIPAPAAEEQ